MSLRYMLLFHYDVPRAARFLVHGLNLKPRYITEKFAELDAGSAVVAIKDIPEDKTSEKKYFTNAIVFDVEDVQSVLMKVLSTKEAEMDGPIQYDPSGAKTAAFRAFGQLFGLVEQPMDHERLVSKESQNPSR